jgi:superfamily II DNA or RNA helicase
VEDYTRLCAGVPAIVFCVDIKHSQLVAECFTTAGYRAAHVDGETGREERRALIRALGSGELQVLCNCGLVSEGLDVPGVVAAILLRPTKSLALYLQQVGRALRPAPGKERALILDHAGNTRRFGLADTPRAWSLDGRAGGGESVVQRCHECGAINLTTDTTCRECGTKLHAPRSTEFKPPGLAERLREMPYERALLWAGGSEQRLRLMALAHGYERDWVQLQMQAFQRLSPARRQAIQRTIIFM